MKEGELGLNLGDMLYAGDVEEPKGLVGEYPGLRFPGDCQAGLEGEVANGLVGLFHRQDYELHYRMETYHQIRLRCHRILYSS